MGGEVVRILLMCFVIIAILSDFVMGEQAFQVRVELAEGIAFIVNDDRARSRHTAIEDALRKAVEQVVGTMVSEETMIQSHRLLNDRIYKTKQGYIQNYKIISEAAEDSWHMVTVEATVALGALKNDLSSIGLLTARKHGLRVIFLIAEQNVGHEDFRYWWRHRASETDLSVTERVLVERFREADFDVVDHAAEAGNVRIREDYRVMNPDDHAATGLGNQYGAEVVIVGKALAKCMGNVADTYLESCEGTIWARAVWADSETIIAFTKTHGTGTHEDPVIAGSEALRKAASNLAVDLVEEIINAWGKEVGGTTLVQMTVTGISSYKNFSRLMNVLKEEMRGVKEVHRRSIMAGVARFDIDMAGDAQYLVDDLMRKDFQDFKINITDLTQNAIELTILSGQQ